MKGLRQEISDCMHAKTGPVLQFVSASKHGAEAAVLLRVQTVPREPLKVPHATRVEVVRRLCENVVQQMSSQLHGAHVWHGGLQAMRAPTTHCRVRANHAAGVTSFVYDLFSDTHQDERGGDDEGQLPDIDFHEAQIVWRENCVLNSSNTAPYWPLCRPTSE